jgi:hypothetical protein
MLTLLLFRFRLFAGKSPDEIVAELATAVFDDLPETLSAEDANPVTFQTNEHGMMTSIAVVLSQEMARFQTLQKKMKSSLVELQKAIKGLIVMSGELELMYQSLLNNQVRPLPPLLGHACVVWALPARVSWKEGTQGGTSRSNKRALGALDAKRREHRL